MTAEEFDTWYSGTFAPAFLSVYQWMETKSPDTAATLRSWHEQLKHLSVAQINDAVALVQSGAEDIGQWQYIPRTLARIAQEQSFASRTREPADLHERRERCRVCHDSGLVMCWAVETMQMARKYVLTQIDYESIKWLEVGLPCECSGGYQFARWSEHRGGKVEVTERIRFSESNWIRCSGDREASQAELIQWARDWKPPNYSDFGEYSYADR